MTDGTVRIRRQLRRAMADHAQATAPRECCGLLLGNGRGVQFAVPTENQASNPKRYRVDARAHFDVQRTLRRFVPALDVVGAYHSHPNGRAAPSERDVAEAHDPDWLHVIVGGSASRPTFGAFHIQGDRVRRLRIRWD